MSRISFGRTFMKRKPQFSRRLASLDETCKHRAKSPNYEDNPTSTGYTGDATDVPEGEVPNLISSKLEDQPGMHGFCVDIDLPCLLVESRTPGHYHLYIDRALSWDEYVPLLRALGEAKIIEPGYVKASINNGATQLRKERFDLHEKEVEEELLEPLKEFLEKPTTNEQTEGENHDYSSQN